MTAHPAPPSPSPIPARRCPRRRRLRRLPVAPSPSTRGSSRRCCRTSARPSATPPRCTPSATTRRRRSRRRAAGSPRFFGAEPREIVFTSGATEANNLAHHRLRAAQPAQGRPRDHHRGRAHLGAQHRQVPREERLPRDARADRPVRARVAEEAARPHHRRDDPRLGAAGRATRSARCSPSPRSPRCSTAPAIALHTDAVAAEGLLPIDMSAVPVEPDEPVVATTSTGRADSARCTCARACRWRRCCSAAARSAACAPAPRTSRASPAWPPPPTSWRRRCRPRWRASRRSATGSSSACSPRSPTRTSTAHPEPSALPNNAHFRFDGVEGEAMILSLRDEGIAASTGSACSSKTLEPSHTLISCGLLHEEAHGSLEFTFGRWSKARTWTASWPSSPASSRVCARSRRCTRRTLPRRRDRRDITLTRKAPTDEIDPVHREDPRALPQPAQRGHAGGPERRRRPRRQPRLRRHDGHLHQGRGRPHRGHQVPDLRLRLGGGHLEHGHRARHGHARSTRRSR